MVITEITEYLVKWWVPQLGDWVLVSTCKSQLQAEGYLDIFKQRLRNNWIGEILVAIVKRVESEAP